MRCSDDSQSVQEDFFESAMQVLAIKAMQPTTLRIATDRQDDGRGANTMTVRRQSEDHFEAAPGRVPRGRVTVRSAWTPGSIARGGAILLSASFLMSQSGCVSSSRARPAAEFTYPVSIEVSRSSVAEGRTTETSTIVVDAAWSKEPGPEGWSQCLLQGRYHLGEGDRGVVSLSSGGQEQDVPVEGSDGTFALLLVLAEEETARVSLYEIDPSRLGEFANGGRPVADTRVRLLRLP